MSFHTPSGIRRGAHDALGISGGHGPAKEYPEEKRFRVARTNMREDGVSKSVAIQATEFISCFSFSDGQGNRIWKSSSQHL